MSPPEKKMQEKHTYLGDGVYASSDGYQISLAKNYHENKVIALAPDVVLSLIRYAIEIGMIAKTDSSRGD